MLSEYIAVQKQGLNFIIVFNVRRVGDKVYTLKPIPTSDYDITDMVHTSNAPGGNLCIRRTVENYGHYDYFATMSPVHKSFTVRLLDTGRVCWAECVHVTRGNAVRILGNRYAANNTKYFSSWNPSVDDMSAIRTYIGDNIETLTVFTQEGKSVVPITSVQRMDTYIPIYHPLTIVPKFVIDGFLRDVVQREQPCPITLEPIRIEDACVTPCFHPMSYDAGVTWIRMHSTCPVCRMICHVTQLHRA